MKSPNNYDQFFLSYSGIRLPLNMVGPVAADEIANRNTYFGVMLDESGRIVQVDKRVYGELELQHHYGYHSNGNLAWAKILEEDGETRQLCFDSSGALCS